MMTRKHVQILVVVLFSAGCTTPNPDFRECTADQPLRCEEATLVRCNGNGTAEVEQSCPLGCNAAERRCIDPVPSNGMAKYLELSSNRSDVDLGESAKINTDTGEILVAGTPTTVDSDVLVQPVGPAIRVLIVRSLAAKDVTVSGANALAIVSGGDLTFNGTFSVSASGVLAGPGSFNEASCIGKLPPADHFGGSGGGGFGSPGGSGGQASGDHGNPGPGGSKSGTEDLIPLRGGCDGGGVVPARTPGAGGGSVQLVSRGRIMISGVVAANGGGALGGGGSGGGILLEAPTVEVSGAVVANGGGGGGCEAGANGSSDVTPAKGGPGCTKTGPFISFKAGGGSGAAGDADAGPGGTRLLGAPGAGGGGLGRIRVNTVPGGLRNTGVFSPNPSLGTLAAP